MFVYTRFELECLYIDLEKKSCFVKSCIKINFTFLTKFSNFTTNHCKNNLQTNFIVIKKI